ncbi:predicted protein [Plenodomus lingam JN3]|uniref:Predicted protein n=1 Tax=Leptosphaeria maculans (strain JN3 / isolate v23.1.3 / race Av1-4-5-6-7-8) TaxID=985895 RepID=E4ZVR2_LEPMJ|nr:predicted protein [Plenodomus lingam JN3]CBX95688.1 predicted protein [Plenodomus lingam JN3]
MPMLPWPVSVVGLLLSGGWLVWLCRYIWYYGYAPGCFRACGMCECECEMAVGLWAMDLHFASVHLGSVEDAMEWLGGTGVDATRHTNTM